MAIFLKSLTTATALLSMMLLLATSTPLSGPVSGVLASATSTLDTSSEGVAVRTLHTGGKKSLRSKNVKCKATKKKGTKKNGGGGNNAAAGGAPKQAKITFKNTANNQPLSPSVFVLHNDQFQLFTVGKPSSEGMALLAETGDPKPIAAAITGKAGILAMGLSDAPVFPGNSSSITLDLPAEITNGKADFLQFSYAGMLINTNDAYAGLNGFKISMNDVLSRKTVTAQGVSFDAGSEENNELCTSIPGPACSKESGNVRSGNGEGTVTTPHGGVLGVNKCRADELSKEELGVDGLPLDERFDFSDPISDITIEFV